MHKRIAERLLESVFYRVSAVAALDENRRVLDVFLFSTDWPGSFDIDKDASEIWLISNHPDGNMMPDAQDETNLQTLISMANGVPVRFFLASEYVACFEVESFKSVKA